MVEFGAWLSLVERLVRDQEVRSSNLRAPTNSLQLCAAFDVAAGPSNCRSSYRGSIRVTQNDGGLRRGSLLWKDLPILELPLTNSRQTEGAWVTRCQID